MRQARQLRVIPSALGVGVTRAEHLDEARRIMPDNERDASAVPLSEVDPTRRYRLVNSFTCELTELSRKFGLAIYGGRVERMDIGWRNSDAEMWEQYALNEDDVLVRGFWNQHPTVVER